jgi:mono/diheme cytochrome c family protein
MNADSPDSTVQDPTQSSPVEGSNGVVICFFVALALLLYLGMAYLDGHAGGFNPMVYAPFTSVKQVAEYHPKSEEAEEFIRGQLAFRTYCAQCHGENGQGTASTGIPPLAGSEWVIAEGPNRVIRIVLNSVQGPITVRGQTYNNPAMPPWRETIPDDAEIARLLNFIRRNPDWGNNASPVKKEQVTKIREATKGRATQWTAEELQGVPVKD